LTAGNPYNRDRQTLSYSAKGTLQLSSAHRIDASFFGDPSKGLNGPPARGALLNQSTSGFSSLTYGGHNQTVRYNGVLSPNFLAEAFFARALNDIAEVPSVNEWRKTDRTVVPNVITGGIGGYEAGNHSLTGNTREADQHRGGHQVKYGVEYDDVFSARSISAPAQRLRRCSARTDRDWSLDRRARRSGVRQDLPRSLGQI